MTTSEQIETYKEETGIKEVIVSDFEYWLFLRQMDELTELED